MEATTQMDEFVSDLMKKVKDEVSAAYYYGKHPNRSERVLYEIEKELSSQLAMQYLNGWRDGRHELLDELKKKVVGGHK